MKKSLLALLFVSIISATIAAESVSKELSKKIAPEKVVNSDDNKENFLKPFFEKVSNRGWILNSEGKKVFKNLLLNLPCGWPEYGIPPLAPYTNEEVIIDWKSDLFKTATKLIRVRVDGLDNILINKLKIGFMFGKKVKYSFTIPKLIVTGKIDTEMLLNLMLEYGISVRYDGEGNFELILENITIDGSFKYKMPFLFGSVKIYNFNSLISMESVVSNIKLNDTLVQFNQLLNDKIEDYLWKAVNQNQEKISGIIEEKFVSKFNAYMKGHTIWYVIGLLGGSDKVCYPPPVPWVSEDNEVL